MTGAVNQHVLELHVAVYDAVRMEIIQLVHQVAEPAQGLLVRDAAAPTRILQRLRPAVRVQHEIHREPGISSRLVQAHIPYLDEMRMVQRGQKLRLGAKALFKELPVLRASREELQRQMRADGVRHLVHRPHAAMPQHAHDTVRSYDCRCLLHGA